MVVGIERIGLAIAAAAIGVDLAIALQLTVPRNTGAEPPWFITVGFIVNAIAAGVLAVAIVWYGLRQIASAEEAMEHEYARSEALLANILPATSPNASKTAPARSSPTSTMTPQYFSQTSPATPSWPATPHRRNWSPSSIPSTPAWTRW